MPTATPRKLFLNLPVRDLKKSMEFFASLGFTFNPQFTDENAACMVFSEDAYAMLLQGPFSRPSPRAPSLMRASRPRVSTRCPAPAARKWTSY